MRRAIAFCKDISASKMIQRRIPPSSRSTWNPMKAKRPRAIQALECELEHVDGTINAHERSDRLLNWLKETRRCACRILTNARCLSEGVDVPALDAILFLTRASPRLTWCSRSAA